MTTKIKNLYSPKTAFGNKALIKAIEDDKLAEERKQAIRECEICDDWGEKQVECEACDGRGHFELTCDHKEVI